MEGLGFLFVMDNGKVAFLLCEYKKAAFVFGLIRIRINNEKMLERLFFFEWVTKYQKIFRMVLCGNQQQAKNWKEKRCAT